MTKHTALYLCHKQANAKLVDFAGWEMPLHYGSQIEEHKIIRNDCGMFDVSHMGIVDIQGPMSEKMLRKLLANDVAKLSPGRALYSCMLNAAGGVIDDLIVYQVQTQSYRLVVNAGTREKDLAWITKQASEFDVEIHERTNLCIIAIQGPQSLEKLNVALTQCDANLNNLKPFHFVIADKLFIARTGYTGENGFEIILPAEDAIKLWESLLRVQVKPCGLGARDTLRLEAGMNLYGADMTEKESPLVSNLGWTVAMEPSDRNFIGKEALIAQSNAGIEERLMGLVLKGRGVLRNHQKVKVAGGSMGEITSGSFSPTFNCGIALARIPTGSETECVVEVRGNWVPAQIIKPPFIKQGNKNFSEGE